jgi:hypothetical protein
LVAKYVGNFDLKIGGVKSAFLKAAGEATSTDGV